MSTPPSAALLTHDLEKAWSLSPAHGGWDGPRQRHHVPQRHHRSSGGVKFSGFGREGGRYSMEDFTELKWLTMQAEDKKMPF